MSDAVKRDTAQDKVTLDEAELEEVVGGIALPSNFTVTVPWDGPVPGAPDGTPES